MLKNFITKWGRYYKVWQALLQSKAALRYYKMMQVLLQSGAGNLLECRAIVITKCGSTADQKF